MVERDEYFSSIYNCIGNGSIICQKAIDAINYYQALVACNDFNQGLKNISEDLKGALLSQAIIAAYGLLLEKGSPVSYIKIKNKINAENFEIQRQEKLIEKIENWRGKYINNVNYKVLTSPKKGVAFLRDKIFAHTDNSGFLYNIDKRVIKKLEEVLNSLYGLYKELLNELADGDSYKTVIENATPDTNENSQRSKGKADLLINLFITYKTQ